MTTETISETTAENPRNSGTSDAIQSTEVSTEAASTAPVAETPPEGPKVPLTLQKRINEATRLRGEAERRAAAAEAEVDRLRRAAETSANPEAAKAALDDAEIERRAAEKAEQLFVQKEWSAKLAAFQTVGEKEFPDFDDRCNTVAAFIDPKHTKAFMEILTDIDDGHRAVAKMADDPDIADRILKLSPHRMVIELAKLAAEKPEKPRPSSKAPEPIGKTPAGAARSDGYRPGMTVEEHVEWAKKHAPYKT